MRCGRALSRRARTKCKTRAARVVSNANVLLPSHTTSTEAFWKPPVRGLGAWSISPRSGPVSCGVTATSVTPDPRTPIDSAETAPRYSPSREG